MKLVQKTQNGVTTSYEVPTSTLLGGAGLVSIITALSALLTNWFVTMPNSNKNLELQEKTFKLQLFQQALENSDSTQRANSLNILIKSQLLEDKSGEIAELINSPKRIPRWAIVVISNQVGVTAESGVNKGNLISNENLQSKSSNN
jgi:predicted choloylglycine hydrolase